MMIRLYFLVIVSHLSIISNWNHRHEHKHAHKRTHRHQHMEASRWSFFMCVFLLFVVCILFYIISFRFILYCFALFIHLFTPNRHGLFLYFSDFFPSIYNDDSMRLSVLSSSFYMVMFNQLFFVVFKIETNINKIIYIRFN